MRFARPLNQLICRVLIGVFLIARLSVSAYACPSMIGPADTMNLAGPAIAHSMAAMKGGCDQLDPDAPSLCAEHCKDGQQTADTAPALVVLASVPTLLYVVPPLVEPVGLAGRSYPVDDTALAAPPPPHSILHCVYRT